jgi:hypothetical protein
MDFSHIGFDVLWDEESKMREDATRAKYLAFVFAGVAGLLLLSIIRTILSSPGSIPDDREWDMATDTEISGEEETQNLLAGTQRKLAGRKE